MGPTNIRYALDLLDRAGSSFGDLATIQPFGRPVYIVSEDSSQEEVDRLSKWFHCRIEDTWISTVHNTQESSANQFAVVDASPPFAIPKVCVTLGLAEPSRFEKRGPRRRTLQDEAAADTATSHESENKDPVGYLLVIQGRNASGRSKLITKSSRKDVAHVMLDEAMNGYSTVFSGAVLRSNLSKMLSPRQLHGPFSFRRVDSPAALHELEGKQIEGRDVINILC